MENLILNVEGLSEELSCVDSYIGEFLGTRPETGAMDDIFRSIRSTRGKMIRPLLLLLAARFGPQRTARRQHLCKLGALVEIVHMASLVHDDIIDDSPLRRGRATIQQQFGKDMAVYAGDFMISRVLRHLSTEQMLQEGLIIANTIEDMCCGELGQMTCRWNTETTTDMYLSNIYGKSVAIFVGALQLGGMGSESPKETVDCLVKIGRHMGFMYQMRDDLLDFISGQQQEGKPVHQDFADGIYTLPVLYAFGQPSCAARLREIAGMDSTGDGYGERLKEVQALVKQSGGIAFSLQQIEHHAKEARLLLEDLPVMGKPPAQDAVSCLGRLIGQLLEHNCL